MDMDTSWSFPQIFDWHFGNSTGTWHYNLRTGKPCNCPYNRTHVRLRKLGGPDLNKVLKAPDKALNTPEGEHFKQELQRVLGDRYDSLAPYMAHRFKRGDIRLGEPQEIHDELAGGRVTRRPLEYYTDNLPLLQTLRDTHKRNEETEIAGEQQNKRDLVQREEELKTYPYGNPDINYEINRLKHELARESIHTPSVLKKNEDARFNRLGRHLSTWHDWYQAKQHPLRRGVNVMDKDFTPAQMADISYEHRRAVEEEKRIAEHSHSGQVVHEFPPDKGGVHGIDWDSVVENEDRYQNISGPHRNTEEREAERRHKLDFNPFLKKEYDSLESMYPKTNPPRKPGWHIKQLETPEDLCSEGQMMGHCIGGDQKYGNCLENDLIDVYSLRDPKGGPHVTWHYNSDGSLAEMYGPNDDPIKPEYQDMLNEWGHQVNKETNARSAVGHQEEDPEEDREVPFATVPASTDMQEYVGHRDNPYEALDGYEDGEGRTVGENTEIEHEQPEWGHIAEDYLNHVKRTVHYPDGTPPEQISDGQNRADKEYAAIKDNFHKMIDSYGDQSEMQEALQEHLDNEYGSDGQYLDPDEKPEPEHVENANSWNEKFPSWEVKIPRPPEPEGFQFPREKSQPGIIWPHTPHLYDPTITWQLPSQTGAPEDAEGQQKIFSRNLPMNMRDGFGRFSTTVPWQPGTWGKGLYFPDTGVIHTWNSDNGMTHLDVWNEDEHASNLISHHLLIRPNGTVRNLGSFDKNFGDAEEDVEGLSQALKKYDHHLQLDTPSSWDFQGPTEPQEEEPSTSRGEQGDMNHGVQTGSDFAGSL